MKQITFLFLLVIATSCKQSQNTESNLTMILQLEIPKRVKENNFNYLYAKIKNQDGSPLKEAQRVLLNKGQLGKDYYEDVQGIIKEIRVRPITLEDKFIEIQIRELSSDPLKGISVTSVNCDNLDQLYTDVYHADMNVRKSGGNIAIVDRQNQQFVISAISKCGWTEEHLQAIWLIIQHGTSGVQAYYYPALKSYAEKGVLKLSNMAMLEDRMLVRNGYKQIYGTQVIDNRLLALENPTRVNERRAKMGMGSIEEYLELFGLNVEEEIKRMDDI